jgi:hypothetical protein
MVASAVKRLALALTLAVSLLPSLALAANKDLVVLNSERWIDTLKGTVKNISADRAEDVVIVVRFVGEMRRHVGPRKSKPTPRQELGQQATKVSALDPGQEAPFEIEIAEKHRTATSWKFEPHAIWRTGVRAHSGRR